MRRRFASSGTAPRSEMWEAYADPDRWSEWAPQIRRVAARGRLREGLEGSVTGLLGVRVRFRVTSVDAEAGRWAWEVRAGVLQLRMEHEVDDGRAAITIDGPAPAVLAYAPVARLALSRLVSLP